MKQDIIIVEGPDKCGKTELSRELSRTLRVPVFKRKLVGFEEKDFFSSKANFMDATRYDQTYIVDFLKQTGYSAIFDRAYPSEYVYSRIFNRQRDDGFLKFIDKKFSKLNTKIIICIKKNYSNIGLYHDELVPQFLLDKIHEQYMHFTIFTSCEVKIVDMTSEDLDSQVCEVMEFLT